VKTLLASGKSDGSFGNVPEASDTGKRTDGANNQKRKED
jgi:hypothetical protein